MREKKILKIKAKIKNSQLLGKNNLSLKMIIFNDSGISNNDTKTDPIGIGTGNMDKLINSGKKIKNPKMKNIGFNLSLLILITSFMV